MNSLFAFRRALVLTAFCGIFPATLALAVSLPAAPATVVRDATGVTIAHGATVTRLEVWSDRIVRVSHRPAGAAPPAASLAVIAEPEPAAWTLAEDGADIVLTTPTLKVRANKVTGTVRFLDARGAPLLEEAEHGTRLEPAAVGGAATWRAQQQFVLDPAEAIYGLGQHQDGAMNYVGRRVQLLQQNTEVAVPVLLSSKGYGVLWDNPAVTEVNVGADNEAVIPSARLLAEDDQPGGLTARYYDDTRFEHLVATRTDASVDFNWSEAAPAGLPRERFSVRWTGSLAVEKAGTCLLDLFADDRVRLWIDGELVLDDWDNLSRAKSHLVKLAFAAPGRHRVRLDYCQENWISQVKLSWQPPAKTHRVVWNSEAGHGVDYYFMHGPEPDRVIAAYRALTGAAPMFGKWAWGFWQCRERYQTQEELLGVVAEYRRRGIPLDGIIQDWQYWSPLDQEKATHGWGSHEFDPARYSDPAGLMQSLHAQHVHALISVWAKFDVTNAGVSIPNLRDLEAVNGAFSPAISYVAPKGLGKWYDPFNARAREIYWRTISRQLFALGLDGWWLDASEPELSGKWGEFRGFATAQGPGATVFNAYPLEHTRAVYEGQRAETSAKRVFILTRSAYAGQQRHAAVVWSGDIHGTWNVFAKQIPAGLNLAASGIPYWNTDIGGFFGGPTKGDPANPAYAELFTRWFQFGAFCPMFRVHGTDHPKEIWRFPEPTQKILIEYVRLRYRLLPYIYSTAWRVTHEGYTMMRPLVMDFPVDAKAGDVSDQFMFGPALLVSPVTHSGATARRVYLPAGSTWLDFWTGEPHAGGQNIEAAAQIGTLPLFVRAGSIMPLSPVMNYAMEQPGAPYEVRIYPGANGAFTLYEDDNETYDYEKGQRATVELSWDNAARTFTLGARQGSFPGLVAEREFRLVLVGIGRGQGTGETAPDRVVHYTGQAITLKL